MRSSAWYNLVPFQKRFDGRGWSFITCEGVPAVLQHWADILKPTPQSPLRFLTWPLTTKQLRTRMTPTPPLSPPCKCRQKVGLGLSTRQTTHEVNKSWKALARKACIICEQPFISLNRFMKPVVKVLLKCIVHFSTSFRWCAFQMFVHKFLIHFHTYGVHISWSSTSTTTVPVLLACHSLRFLTFGSVLPSTVASFVQKQFPFTEIFLQLELNLVEWTWITEFHQLSYCSCNIAWSVGDGRPCWFKTVTWRFQVDPEGPSFQDQRQTWNAASTCGKMGQFPWTAHDADTLG